MSQVGQTWSLSRGESEQLHTLSYLYKLILIGDLTVVTHYSHLLLMKKKTDFENSNAPIQWQHQGFLSLLVCLCSSGWFFCCLSAGFATAQPLHGCKSNKTSNELQMYCQTSLCPAHRKCRCMCCKMKPHRQPKYNYLQIQMWMFKDKKTIKYTNFLVLSTFPSSFSTALPFVQPCYSHAIHHRPHWLMLVLWADKNRKDMLGSMDSWAGTGSFCKTSKGSPKNSCARVEIK